MEGRLQGVKEPICKAWLSTVLLGIQLAYWWGIPKFQGMDSDHIVTLSNFLSLGNTIYRVVRRLLKALYQ